MVKFKPLSQAGVTYQLQWKEVAASWESMGSAPVISTTSSKAEAAPLEPGTTYCVRLSVTDAAGVKGTPGSELIIDTEQVGCTPKGSSGCCVVL
jgi:hypothetical protein